MNESSPTGDPVTDVILDFQSVMAQWLELQATVIGAAQRTPLVTASVPQSPGSSVEGPMASAAVAAPAAVQTEPVAVSVAADERSAYASERRAAGEGHGARGAVANEKAPPPAASRYTLSVRPCPASHARGGLAPAHAVVVTDDGAGIAEHVAGRLRREGLRVAVVKTAGEADRSHGIFVSSLDSVEEAERLALQIRDGCGPVAALIHLAPLSPSPDFAELDSRAWWDRLSSETRALFLLARVLGAPLQHAGRNGGAAVVSVTSMGGAFGVVPAAGSLSPSHGGTVGLAKCLAIEWPNVRVRALDLDAAAGPEVCAAQVIHELWELESPTEIGYFGGQRVGLGVDSHPPVPADSFEIPSDGVILATGGARGITAEVCLELAERYQPTFVLVGQSPLPPPAETTDTAGIDVPADVKRALTARLQAGGGTVTPAAVERAYRTLMKEREIREMISRLSATGARSHYVQMDVQDADAFGALIDEIYDTYGRIDGVVHGAGIIEDKLVCDKTLESFDRVFRTKTLSAFTLARRLRPASLKFLALFSSVAGRFGNRGQADYAAANEVMSKLAVRLQREWPARVCAVAWAPWDKLGMVSPELKREFARRGVGLLSPTAGRRALWHEIQQSPAGAAEVVVAGAGDPSPIGDERDATPLLKTAARSASGDTIRFDRLLDPSVDRYLNDHKLDNRPVLPLAFATEHMAQAAQAVWPDLRVVGVRGLQMFKGITLESDPVRLVVTVTSQLRRTNDGFLEADAEIVTPGLTPALRYRSIVQLAAHDQEAPAWEPARRPLEPLSRPLNRAYREWTFHGPLFQRVTSIAGVGPDSILGTIYSSSAITGLSNVRRAQWILDPFVFDAALQLLLIWSREHNDKTALPSRFHAFRRYAPLSDGQLTCDVAVESLAGGHALKSTVRFVDAAGRLLAVLEGMEANCTEALNRLATVTASEGRHE